MKTYKPVHNFASGVRVAFSSVIDESIAAGAGSEPLPRHTRAATDFLHKYGFNADERVTVFVTYSSKNTYAHVERVDENPVGSLRSDALFTTVPGKVITLPVADCIATVVYDPVARLLGVLHLGRHSSVAGLIEESAIRVADEVGSDPHDWHVWMSPSLQADSNFLDYFEPPFPERWSGFTRVKADGKIHLDMPGHNRERFERLGVSQDNIYVSPIDTFTDERYFSHRAAVELGRPERQGRMMVAAVMT